MATVEKDEHGRALYPIKKFVENLNKTLRAHYADRRHEVKSVRNIDGPNGYYISVSLHTGEIEGWKYDRYAGTMIQF